MKTIGLLGGMSWESSLVYYRLINQAVGRRLGGFHSAQLLLYSVDFAAIERMQTGGRWSDAGEMLGGAAAALERGGAELLVLCTNTMHRVAADIERRVNIPFLHVADVTAAAVKAARIGRVGLLGTRFTMEQAFYRERLGGSGLDVVVPGAADRELVHRIIYDELCHGRIEPSSRAALSEVVDRLRTDGAQGVILGCTELGMLLAQEHCPLPLFDTTTLHAEAAVDRALV